MAPHDHESCAMLGRCEQIATSFNGNSPSKGVSGTALEVTASPSEPTFTRHADERISQTLAKSPNFA